MFLEHNSNIMLEFQILLCFGNIMFLEHNVRFSSWKEICSTPLSQCNRIGEEFNLKSVREKSDGNAGGRIYHPMAVGEMWIPHTAIRRRQETLPSVRHPTAP